MGTSTSFRSPDHPRWNAVIARYLAHAPTEQVRAEIFNAGPEWAEELGQPAIAAVAEALVAAHELLYHRLAQAERPDLAIQDTVADARRHALTESGGPALAVAERALQRTLIGVVRGDRALMEMSASEASDAWLANRGPDPSPLVRRFLGEVLHQFTSHVVARDAGRLLGRKGYETGEHVRRLERELAEAARSVAEAVQLPAEIERPSAWWAEAITAAFQIGGALPQHD
jgi:hypothetical protein